jgi:hypothetical protein
MSLSRRRAPQHARALARMVKLGLCPLFLRRTSMLRSCRPRRHGLSVGACFVHAVAEEGAPSFLVVECTPRHRPSLPHTRAFVPSCGCLVRRHPWSRPELRHGLRHAASLQQTPDLSPSRSSPTTVRTQAHTRTRKFARLLTRESARPPAAYRRCTDAAVPTPASTSPHRSPPS